MRRMARHGETSERCFFNKRGIFLRPWQNVVPKGCALKVGKLFSVEMYTLVDIVLLFNEYNQK